ncbi:YcbK family protein [Papillibacter cinnamivorans]|uniref:Peptidase M15 n=1 Tax=Papillibacter cinnamivorans DSM 12816 TaxID=1122930 RepID=A0A1W1YXI3_9FIRM|nr:D-Ala-D-Ala carboxypeptidase family metallohydrolase [Papillibacter cinnamivorans]SMC40917.1 Peptidase M15 [Papillibacter cinnamivorans DSM 12816]
MATVRAYYLPTDGEKQIAPHFKIKEFACNDGELAILIADELPVLLEKIRVHFGKPVKITGPYRNPSYNKYVAKGVDGSQHKLGTAADIQIEGISPRTVAKYADTLMPATGGIGLYEYTSGGFTHVDVRATKSRWLQTSKTGSAVSVSGF